MLMMMQNQICLKNRVISFSDILTHNDNENITGIYLEGVILVHLLFIKTRPFLVLEQFV